MTNAPHELEGQDLPQKPIPHHLSEGGLYGSGDGGEIMHGEIQKALKTLRGGSGSMPSLPLGLTRRGRARPGRWRAVREGVMSPSGASVISRGSAGGGRVALAAVVLGEDQALEGDRHGDRANDLGEGPGLVDHDREAHMQRPVPDGAADIDDPPPARADYRYLLVGCVGEEPDVADARRCEDGDRAPIR